MDKTPIQQALHLLGMMRQTENENIRMTLNANEVAMMLNSLLSAEKAFVGKVWERSMNSTYDNTHYDKEDECLEMDFSFVEKMKQQFINQLYPKS